MLGSQLVDEIRREIQSSSYLNSTSSQQYRNARTVYRKQGVPHILRLKNEDVPAECVYKIPCSNCSLSYVGQTNDLNSRIARHRRAAIKKSDVSSAIVSQTNGRWHEIYFDGAEVLTRSAAGRYRVTMEAIMIQQTGTFVGNKADYKFSLRGQPGKLFDNASFKL
ncbi:hypothetical protein ACOME3_004159 [Neoechinorhynchus agilis]